MSLTVQQSRVKEKCGIDNSDYDLQINNVIGDWVPVIEYALQDSALADTGNTGLQATLNLGATELVSGEFYAQFARNPGAYDSLTIMDVSVRPFYGNNPLDPTGMKAQGLERLRPFLKKDPLLGSLAVISMTMGKEGGDS